MEQSLKGLPRETKTTLYSHLNGSKISSHWTKKKKLSRRSVLASYVIFYSKSASESVDPPFITWCLLC